jgi:multimeric flavodoxin WrbA
MKVMAINSSSRPEGQSVTDKMLNQLVAGMREAGAEVEVVQLRKKKIKDCKGCYQCQTESIGKCVIKDDMTELLPKWTECDMAVYATPLFHHFMNVPMKRFIERTFPVCQPFFRQRKDGRWTNTLRCKYPVVVLMAVGGYLDETAFSSLSHYARFLWGRGLIAEIYRPASEFMVAHPGNKPDEVLDATRKAGIELVTSMKVSEETMARVKQPLGEPEDMLKLHNMYWEARINAIQAARAPDHIDVPPAK